MRKPSRLSITKQCRTGLSSQQTKRHFFDVSGSLTSQNDSMFELGSILMKKLLTYSLLGLLGFTATSSVGKSSYAEEASSKMHFVAIGVSDYQHDVAKKDGEVALKDLKFADRDAKVIVDVIRANSNGETKLTLLADGSPTDSLPTRRNVQRALQEAVKNPTDTLVIMFFGHGVDLDNSSYLCLADTRISRKPGEIKYSIDNGLDVQELSDLLASAQAKTKVLVTDACRSLGTPDENVDLAEVRNYDIGRHLKASGKDHVVGQHFILSSCLPNQVAIEADELGHGVFANFLIEGLRGKCDADKGNRDGEVSLQELFYYTARRTSTYALEKAGRKQLPWIQMGSSEEITVSTLSAEVRESLASEFRYVSFNANEFSYEQQQAMEKYAMALEAFGALEINQCISLLNNVIEVIPNLTEAVRLRALCYTLSGQELQAIDELKKLTRTLKAKVFSKDSNLLGVRDPQNTAKKLLDFQEGDVIEIKDFSPEGKNSSGATIPKGKYLYVSRIKKKGTDNWVDAQGVVFADVIKPTSIEQVAERIQASQREFGNTTVQSKDDILQKTGIRGVSVASNATPAQKFERAVIAAEKGINLANAIQSRDPLAITGAGAALIAPNAAPKIQVGINAYSRFRGMIGY
jgi:uncharacterized caspase-like protein